MLLDINILVSIVKQNLHENSLLNIGMYISIIVSIVHQILPCKICSKKNSEDQKSKKHPKHNGVENDKTKPFKCTELTKVEHVTSKLREDEFNE